MVNNSRVLVILDPENINMATWHLAMEQLWDLGLEPTYKIAAASNKSPLSIEYHRAILDAGFELEFFDTSCAKDGADICLISRALQIYYRTGFDVVYFISYDSDFQYLARILGDEGVHTIGIDGDRLSPVMRPFLHSTLEPKQRPYDLPEKLIAEIKSLLKSPWLVDDNGWLHVGTATRALQQMIAVHMGTGLSHNDILDSLDGVTIRKDKNSDHVWIRLRRPDANETPCFESWRVQVQHTVLGAMVKCYDRIVETSGHPIVEYRTLLAHIHRTVGIPALCISGILQYSKRDIAERLNDVVPHLEFHGWTEGNMLVVRPEYKSMAA